MAKVIVIYTFIFSLLANFTITTSTETDSCCFEFTEDSAMDPNVYFNPNNYFNPHVECWNPDDAEGTGIELSDRGLKGQFPPGFENCPTVVGLNLSHNRLQGPIPSDICKRLPFLTFLDLSFNIFSGEIPASIANCSFLNDLRLDHNQLIGNIPPKIAWLERLKNFSVADNLLSGPVPEFGEPNSICAVIRPINCVSSSVNVNYSNNPGLCGGPLEPCKRHRNEFYSSFKTGFVAGYTFFAVSTMIGFLSYYVPWEHVKIRNKMITITTMVMLMMRKKRKEADNIRGSPTVEFMHGGEEISMLEKKVPRLGYTDLNDATNNFSKNNVIGEGKMGMLYKAALPNCYLLAVKKLHNLQFLEEQFISELKTLGILRHVNLLPLLGFCFTSKCRLLVYKYMPNGNLYDWLHPMEGQTKRMEWTVGLAWLHQGCSNAIRVIHLNISSKCILLDQNFEPKLSNFGEAIIISPTSSYVNGEPWATTFAKEDVYGLGVVLLELITGMDFSKMTDSSSSILNEWLLYFLSRFDFSDAIDKSLIGKGFDAEIFQVLKVACNCVDTIPDERPTMLQVYNDINAIRQERCEQVDEAEILMQDEILPATSKGESVEIEIAECQ